MIDRRIKDSIREAVEMHEQPVAVADKIIKWFENVSEGNESLDVKDDYRRRLNNLFSALDVKDNGLDL